MLLPTNLLLIPPGNPPPAAAARLLHSKRSDVACSLTVRNRSLRPLEALWVNYDGDEEPYTVVPPGHAWTVDTYETHPWRFRDPDTGDLVCEYVAQRGERLLQLYDNPQQQQQQQQQQEALTQPPSSQQPPQQQPQEPQLPQQQPPGLEVGGFDGLGNRAEQYTEASLLSVVVVPQGLVPEGGLGEGGGVVVLGLEGYERPLSLLALGGTLERVVITRQAGVGVFVSHAVADLVQQQYRDAAESGNRAVLDLTEQQVD
ncbi:hypothetical protein VOLCADRAFT_91208 [Volvox carteri f. nagariensis]|uniref:Uncharacterized protein vhlA n=1 Tax=Volvox carteri f. nagariensis TaxID=3068 RepID=D8TWG7_VOLCA|nr:uncharacterized protein VOLCADRAFT_91208 [Volvox carteri f. nagariensis]EFJ48150.1 hypothetical protein VOLCADRAFT_91208 [Volvox carteri f. nagariensis]|eukprot:XP_002950835.1 hypothetical protein VOLCADRAFT_91208 [Volvox carteri f. nagariensis]